jgi:CheY-like chemotaxis protein
VVQAARKLPTGNERILLVDDEPVLVEIGTRQLESLGYTVAGATGSVDALARFMRDPGAFDLVITDMTMPQMAGDQLSRRIFAVRPDIPIILCTGFTMRITEKKALAMGIRAFIMKPLVAAHLAETVRRVLDDANASHTAADGMRM